MSFLRKRSSGVLLHPTSLPGPHGSGDLGVAAHAFVAWLGESAQSAWQMLPVVPPAGGNSPYQSTSAFAGDPALIPLEPLLHEGLLTRDDLEGPAGASDDTVRFDLVGPFRRERLRRAFEAFRTQQSAAADAFLAWCQGESTWLDDFALFSALKDEAGGSSWTSWAPGLRARDPRALAEASARLRVEVRFHQFVQWRFHLAWTSLREAAQKHGVALVGDIPIFVGHDSADVWAHQTLFQLDAAGEPTFVAGVPPDYFSATGQRWGNVLYRWDVHAKTGYAWWAARFRSMLARFDAVRVDHFIGFHRYWAIPASSPTAIEGHYEPGPGAALFDALARSLGEVPIIAEDLGVVTPEVTQLRLRFGFPGMQVLQFSLSPDPSARGNLPHAAHASTVVYTGTHDNDTTRGWFDDLVLRAKKDGAAAQELAFVKRYLPTDGTDIAWDMLRLAFRSHAATAIVPVQDLLGLPTEARMNVPGKTDGNWGFRVNAGALDAPLAARLRELTETYARDGRT